LQTFLFLRGKALHLEHDGLNLLPEHARGALQRVDLALSRGDGDFLVAEFRLRLLEARLQFRLLALQRAAALAGFGNFFLKLQHIGLELGNLVFATEN
jgi:hypothetical protein